MTSQAEGLDARLLQLARNSLESGDFDGFPLELVPVLARRGGPDAREMIDRLREHGESGAASAQFRERLYRALAEAAPPEEARRLQQAALDLVEEAAQGDPARQARLLSRHAALHEEKERLEEAEALRRWAVTLLERGEPRDLIEELGRLSALLEALGRLQEALALSERACGLLETAPGAGEAALLGALSRRIGLLERLGRWREEADLRAEWLRRQQARAGTRSSLAHELFRLAVALERLGEYQEALEAYRQAEAARRTLDKEWWGGASPNPEAQRRDELLHGLGMTRCLAVLGPPGPVIRAHLQELGHLLVRGRLVPLVHRLCGLAVPLEAAGVPGLGPLLLQAWRFRGLPGPNEELAWRALATVAADRGKRVLQEQSRRELERLERARVQG